MWKNKKNIELYNNFRSKILSEEFFVHNNLNIQILLRINENNLTNNKDKYLLIFYGIFYFKYSFSLSSLKFLKMIFLILFHTS